MTREQLESTARLDRGALLGLLDAMKAADPAPQATNAQPAPVDGRAFAQRAALLPPTPPIRFPRATRPPLSTSAIEMRVAFADAPKLERVAARDDQLVEILSKPCNELGHWIQVSGRRASRRRLPLEMIASLAAILIVGLWALFKLA